MAETMRLPTSTELTPSAVREMARENERQQVVEHDDDGHGGEEELDEQRDLSQTSEARADLLGD